MLRADQPRRAFRSQLLLLSRNFGSIAAVREVLRAAPGDHFAVIAADLQEPPELVVDFFRTLEGGDVVVEIRDLPHHGGRSRVCVAAARAAP